MSKTTKWNININEPKPACHIIKLTDTFWWAPQKLADWLLQTTPWISYLCFNIITQFRVLYLWSFKYYKVSYYVKHQYYILSFNWKAVSSSNLFFFKSFIKYCVHNQVLNETKDFLEKAHQIFYRNSLPEICCISKSALK